MLIPPLPPDEEQRLTDLFNYDILDTESEELFDELAQLASDICKTPVALVSLVDPKRQWFKSRIGTDLAETSRDIAFCAYAILQREVFEVSDAAKDERFRNNPLVVEQPNIRFYAGAPLITPNGHAIGTLCAISDQPKKLSGSQKHALETLGRAVIAQLELRKKNRELRRINQFKSEFLSYVSHEIRTPLNAINTFSKLLEEEARAKALSSFFTESLTHIVKSGDRLLEIVNSVLDIKQLEAGKLKLMPRVINSNDFFVHLFTLMNVRAEDENVHFQWHIDPSLPQMITLDDTKYGQIVLNILSNAIKYTPADKKVACQIFCANEKLILVVKDEGIGISEADQQRLFSAYHRTDDAQPFKGTGLGLAITKGLVELMQGDINVKSQPGVGSTFKVSIPLPPPPTAQQVNRSQTVQQHTPLNIKADPAILVVEDHEINQAVIKSLFAKFGLQIDIASSGEEGLNHVAKRRYDLVFMDINLPGISGREAATIIKAKQPNLPVVALTADAVTDQATMLAHGLDAVLTKPVEHSALIRILNMYLHDTR